MRHKVAGKKLGRNATHRRAMINNMVFQLLKHEKIITTKSKAKLLRQFVEPIIHRAKVKNLHNIRLTMSKLKNRKIVQKLFDTIAPRYESRNGGYTRIILLPHGRRGDNAKMAYIELLQ